MAVGAPSESFVDPLVVLYGHLMVAYGAGVYFAAVRQNRGLQFTGLLLIAYGAVGATGPIFFEMQPRGSGNIETDLPHIVLTGGQDLDTNVGID